MSAKWYALQTKPRKEWAVYDRLENEGVEIFFPVIRVQQRGTRRVRERAYFPSYMFVCVDLEQRGKDALRWIPGAKGLVRFGGEPVPVPESLVANLKKQLARLREERPRGLRQGDRVRIVGGPLKGYDAIFDAHRSGKQRIDVLMSLLGHTAKRLRLDADDVEKAD